MDDYARNLERYPEWQSWLRTHQPPTLVLWGQYDPFFVPAGALAYRKDVPDAEVHLYETGHFALEESLNAIVDAIDGFITRHHR